MYWTLQLVHNRIARLADTEMIALNYGKLIDRTNVFLSLSLFYCCLFNFFFIGITCNGWIFSFLFLKGTLWSLLYTSNLFDVLEFTFLNNSIFKKKENNTFVSVMFSTPPPPPTPHTRTSAEKEIYNCHF